MKKILFFTLIFSIFYFIINKNIFAQTPSILKNCGFGGVAGMDKCCEGLPNIDIGPELQQTKEKASKIPGSDMVLDMALGMVFDAVSELSKGIINKAPFINEVVKKCYLGEPVDSSGHCICKQTIIPTPAKLENLCEKFTNGEEKEVCLNCSRGGAILTGMGCIPLNLTNFVSDFLLKRMIGLAGLIALLCIIYAAFTLQTSAGNPEKIKKAQELLTSCIMGLMLIIFSVFILKLIGIDILRIPGFGK